MHSKNSTTHWACDEKMEKYGGRSTCCACEGCEFCGGIVSLLFGAKLDESNKIKG